MCVWPIVVWNPWIDKAREIQDFGDDEYPNMVCVEAGHVSAPVILLPGTAFEASQILQVMWTNRVNEERKEKQNPIRKLQVYLIMWPHRNHAIFFFLFFPFLFLFLFGEQNLFFSSEITGRRCNQFHLYTTQWEIAAAAAAQSVAVISRLYPLIDSVEKHSNCTANSRTTFCWFKFFLFFFKIKTNRERHRLIDGKQKQQKHKSTRQ